MHVFLDMDLFVYLCRVLLYGTWRINRTLAVGVVDDVYVLQSHDRYGYQGGERRGREGDRYDRGGRGSFNDRRGGRDRERAPRRELRDPQHVPHRPAPEFRQARPQWQASSQVPSPVSSSDSSFCSASSYDTDIAMGGSGANSPPVPNMVAEQLLDSTKAIA